jgi:hypothetical protein
MRSAPQIRSDRPFISGFANATPLGGLSSPPVHRSS